MIDTSLDRALEYYRIVESWDYFELQSKHDATRCNEDSYIERNGALYPESNLKIPREDQVARDFQVSLRNEQRKHTYTHTHTM